MRLLNWLKHPASRPKPEWAVLKQTVRSRFPEVHHISTAALADRLAQAQPPVLLDTRTEEEFAVSHLQNAQWVDPDEQMFACLNGLAPNTPIVTYCSVGYRSAAVCDRLQSAGFTNVVNLEGSIFEWANEGRPIYRGDRVVRQVHPYNSFWGLLLRRELHSWG